MSVPVRTLKSLAVLCTVALVAACDPSAEGESESGADSAAPETAGGRISYGAGYAMAENLRQQLGDDFDGASFAMGVDDAVTERERRVDDEALGAARDEIVARRQAEAEATAEEKLAEAQAFLEENASKEGITTTESGLQYEVIKEGDGASPEATDTVVTHYTGTLLDGTVFDSSEERGEPATFGLDRVIPGWTEALQLMEVGDRWRLWLPPELAYGTRSPSDVIPPNALLVFEVELLDVNPEGEASGEPSEAAEAAEAAGEAANSES